MDNYPHSNEMHKRQAGRDTSIRLLTVDLGPSLRDFLRENNALALSAGALHELCACHERWSRELICLRAEMGAGQAAARGLLFIFLPQAIEEQAAEAWLRSPSRGYLLHNLAQFLCRAALGKLLPKVGERGCAPLPELTPVEAEALHLAVAAQLREVGMCPPVCFGPGASARTYSLLTYYPYIGGCEVCSLREGCPRLR